MSTYPFLRKCQGRRLSLQIENESLAPSKTLID